LVDRYELAQFQSMPFRPGAWISKYLEVVMTRDNGRMTMMLQT
jgi:hypothetical protein